MAEYYFDYKVKKLKTDYTQSPKATPKFYVEKNYDTNNVSYQLYMTLPIWDAGPSAESRPDQGIKKVDFFYDVCAVGIDTVSAIKSHEEAKRNKIEHHGEFNFGDYKKSKYRFVIAERDDDFSGVGKIVLRGDNGQENVYFAAVNFTFKKKIKYSIDKTSIYFTGIGLDKPVTVSLFASEVDESGFYPCLKKNTDAKEGYKLKISLDGTGKTKYELPPELRENMKDKPIFVGFDSKDEELRNHYLLVCESNYAFENKYYTKPELVKFCPYCHAEPSSMVYKHHSTGCDGSQLGYGSMDKFAHQDIMNGKKPEKKTMFCSEDFGTPEGGKILTEDKESIIRRVLPDKFLEHNHFKVIITGSKRAGKSTFISRLFDINGTGKDIDCQLTSLRNGTKRIFKATSYPIKTLKFPLASKNTINVSKDSWYKENQEFYSRYSIDIGTGLYLKSTNTTTDRVSKLEDIRRNPFVMEVENKSYVYFYDMAGEDAQRSGDFIYKLVRNAPAAIFYLIDSKAKPEETIAVARRIEDALRERRSIVPVAVILTKFDAVENEFDDNCQCLRSDVQQMIKSRRYEQSELERHINISSEEIRSYLSQKGICPDFGENAVVKYFATSAYCAGDSIYHADQRGSEAEVNYLLHYSSVKRMELPVIWTLYQLGCIN